MPECAKTHLQQTRISKFSGEDPRTPSSRGGEGGEEREGKGKGMREGKDREGRGGTGRDRGGKEGGEGRGGALDMGSAPQGQALDPPLNDVPQKAGEQQFEKSGFVHE